MLFLNVVPVAILTFLIVTQSLFRGRSFYRFTFCFCAQHEYNDNKFSILARGHTSFHLSTLEATYIKTFKPNLCKQKKFVYGLKITH